MKCAGCGENNDEGYRFCRRCGRALPSAETAATPDTPQAPTAYTLVATSGLLSGRTFTIGPKGLMIGRDPANCQVVIADDEVSRLHAWIGFDDEGELVLRDRHSANGTYVNQVRVQEKTLRPADVISLGAHCRQTFRIEGSLAPGATRAASTGAAAVSARGDSSASVTRLPGRKKKPPGH